jgi:di/tricarboxylate transporter
LEIRRRANSHNPFLKTINQKIAGPETVIEGNDVLYLSGSFDHVHLFALENRVDMIDLHESEEEAPAFGGKIRFDEIGIAEVVVLANSKLVNQSVKKSGFREKYKVNILGISRQKQHILRDLKEERIHSGDVLLVQGEWNDIARLTEESSEWVVVGQPLAEASKITLDHKAPLAAAMMIGMVLLMVFDVVPAVAAVLMAAVGMILTGCFRNAEEAYKTINWESVVLIGAMLPMSMAIEKTGAAAAISHGLVAGLGSFGPIALMAGIYFATSLLTLFISNTACAVLFAPIALQSALAIGVSPYPFLFAVTVAASMCFASPFSTPPNALVMSAGRYTFMDFVKVGLPLQILYGIVMMVVLPLLWKF